MELFVFLVAGGACIAGALGVVLNSNPVHAALSLVGTLFGIAVLFVAQEANFLAAVQVIVYAGAIVVLFLFVIMLLGVDREETLRDPVRIQRPAAIALGVILLAEIIFLSGYFWANHWTTGNPAVRGRLDAEGGNVETVARSLFTDFLWPFEVTAVLLVAAVIGGVVLARRSSRPVDDDPEADDAGAGGGSEEVTTR
jgi:NADH-quinone oxidoreductase subunit J